MDNGTGGWRVGDAEEKTGNGRNAVGLSQQECYSQIRSLPHAITQFQQTFLLATSLRNMLPVEGRAPRTP